MKKINLILVFLVINALSGWSQDQISKSEWKQKEIVIDGDDREWTKPLGFSEQKSGMAYSICNDNGFLYLNFSFSDEMKMRKILSVGWSIELSSKEKGKRFSTSLTFTPMPKMSLGIRRNVRQGEPKVDVNLIVRAYLSEASVVTTSGFRSNSIALRLNDQNQSAEHSKIAIGVNSTQDLVFEIAIPLKELLAENAFQLEELLTLGVEINALEMTSMGGGFLGSPGARPEGGGSGGGGSRSFGGRPGGAAPGGGAGPGGGAPGGGAGPGGGLFEKVSFKQKFTLVKN